MENEDLNVKEKDKKPSFQKLRSVPSSKLKVWIEDNHHRPYLRTTTPSLKNSVTGRLAALLHSMPSSSRLPRTEGGSLFQLCPALSFIIDK